MNNLQKLLFAFLISPLLSIKGEIDIQPEQHMSQRGSARSHSDDVVFRHIGEHQLVEGKELKTIEMPLLDHFIRFLVEFYVEY